MSWKSFACLAAVAAMTAPAAAQLSVSINDLGGGDAELFVTSTVDGSLAAELAVTLSGGSTIGTVTPNLTDWVANPGDNPFIAGSPVGGDTTGFAISAPDNGFFASYGSNTTPEVTPAGTYKLLDFTYSGSGLGSVTGLVAQLGGIDDTVADLDVTLTDGGGFQTADFNMSGGVNLIDLSILGTNFEPGVGGKTNAQGDASGDGIVDLVDLSILGTQFDSSSPATAVPEPSAILIGAIGVVAGMVRRRV